jgi:hypothetical protein
LASFEIKVFRKTAGCTLLDHEMSYEILEELKVEPSDEKLRRYKQIGYEM